MVFKEVFMIKNCGSTLQYLFWVILINLFQNVVFQTKTIRRPMIKPIVVEVLIQCFQNTKCNLVHSRLRLVVRSVQKFILILFIKGRHGYGDGGSLSNT